MLGPVTRKELQELSRIRFKEAKALLDLGMSDGAYYLAGYAVECALKACIAKQTQRYEFPDKKRVEASYTHSLGALAKLAGLEQYRQDLARQDQTFGDNWEVVLK